MHSFSPCKALSRNTCNKICVLKSEETILARRIMNLYAILCIPIAEMKSDILDKHIFLPTEFFL